MTIFSEQLAAYEKFVTARAALSNKDAEPNRLYISGATNRDLDVDATTVIETRAKRQQSLLFMYHPVGHDWFTNKNEAVPRSWTSSVPVRPFDLIDERAPANQQFQTLTNVIRRFPDVPYVGRLVTRLKRLRKAAEEEADCKALVSEGEEAELQAPISIGSLRTFVQFLRSSQRFAEPVIVLTRDGNLVARWQKGPNKLCTAEFLPRGRIIFLVFSPDLLVPGQINRVSGVVPYQSFFAAIEPYRVMEWMAP